MTEVEKAAALEKLIASSANYSDTYLSKAEKNAYRVLAPRTALVKAAVEFALMAGLNHCVITNVVAGQSIDIKLPKTLDQEIVRFAAALPQMPYTGKLSSLSDLYDAGLLSSHRDEHAVNRPEGKLCEFVARAREAMEGAYRDLVNKPIGALTGPEIKMIYKSDTMNDGAMRQLFAVMAIGKETGLFDRPETPSHTPNPRNARLGTFHPFLAHSMRFDPPQPHG